MKMELVTSKRGSQRWSQQFSLPAKNDAPGDKEDAGRRTAAVWSPGLLGHELSELDKKDT